MKLPLWHREHPKKPGTSRCEGRPSKHLIVRGRGWRRPTCPRCNMNLRRFVKHAPGALPGTTVCGHAMPASSAKANESCAHCALGVQRRVRDVRVGALVATCSDCALDLPKPVRPITPNAVVLCPACFTRRIVARRQRGGA